MPRPRCALAHHPRPHHLRASPVPKYTLYSKRRALRLFRYTRRTLMGFSHDVASVLGL